MKIETQINQFLEKKKTAWSETTLKSMAAFLRNYATDVCKGNAQVFLERLRSENKNAYSIQTYFIHAGNFYDFLYPTKENVFRTFRKDNRNEFKNAYQSKALETDYETVRQAIEAQEECPEKQAALYLLKTAQRASEAGLARRNDATEGASNRSEQIIGKGGKARINLGADRDFKQGVTYYRVRSWLQRVCGVTPHSLRKLALTRAGERGASAADLCEIAGWSSIVTGIRYLQPRRAEALRAFLD